MLPSDVRIEPYKINFYNEGGQFAKHVDTPSVGFVGTIVIIIHDSESKLGYYDNRYFSVHDQEMSSKIGNVIGFYGDIPHELRRVTGFRVTL